MQSTRSNKSSQSIGRTIWGASRASCSSHGCGDTCMIASRCGFRESRFLRRPRQHPCKACTSQEESCKWLRHLQCAHVCAATH